MSDLQAALRALQKLDEVVDLPFPTRMWLIAAESELGAALGLACTGEVDGWWDEAATRPAAYSHSDETCPIHEWLVPEDQAEAQDLARRAGLHDSRKGG